MSKDFKMQTVRGVRDIYGHDAVGYNNVVAKATSLATVYNYEHLLLPIFEFSEIYHRTLGETSDVVSKETYTFTDRDGSSLTLRPEFTAGVVRSIISNGLTQSMPIKYFSYGPVFRHERPQKARYRQFNQINFESIGEHGVYSDIELIRLGFDVIASLGLAEDVKIEISSLGDIESRLAYKAALVEYLSKYESSLSEDSKKRLHKNPIRILDSKDAGDKEILVNAPKIFDKFTKESLLRFDEVQDGLQRVGVPYTINQNIVRGLDYYTHTVFEFVTNKLGSQGTVLAGGRYDGLFELMGGPSIPAIGFAAGLERLAELANNTIQDKKLVYLIPVGEKALDLAPKTAHILRNQGCIVDYSYHQNIAKQLQRANKNNATYCLIFGETEISAGNYKLRYMKTGEEKLVTLEDVARL